MNTAEIELDLNALYRLARAWLDGSTRIVIDAQGVAITVPNERAARRIAESHGLSRVLGALTLTWVGKLGVVPVTVTVEAPGPVPTQGRAA